MKHLKPIYSLQWKNVPEVVAYGATHFKSVGDEIQGDPAFELITSDLLKPWLMLACDVWGTDAFWALGLASHCASESQLSGLKRLMQESDSGEEELICPRYQCSVLDDQLIEPFQNPSRLLHPCSGKHLVMLAECKAQGWPTDQYWEASHPLQKHIFSYVAQQVREPMGWVTDDCGLPTAVMSSESYVKIFENMALSQEKEFQDLRQLWLNQYEIVGGERSFETDLMRIGEGQIMVKTSLSGVLVLQTCGNISGRHSSCLIKLASEANDDSFALALYAALQEYHEQLPEPMLKVLDYLDKNLRKWIPIKYEMVLPKDFKECH